MKSQAQITANNGILIVVLLFLMAAHSGDRFGMAGALVVALLSWVVNFLWDYATAVQQHNVSRSNALGYLGLSIALASIFLTFALAVRLLFRTA